MRPFRIQKLKEIILKYYLEDKLSARQIAKLININPKTVWRILKENNITRSLSASMLKYPCDDFYFHDINTEEKAYWLGVLYADGNVSKLKTSSGVIKFSAKDKEWVVDFMKAIKSTNIPNRETHNRFPDSVIWKAIITSEQMFNDLCKLGCVPIKSLIIQFPNISISLIPHFIRGYFDGDGTVGVYVNRKDSDWKILKSGFCSGSKIFLEKLVTYLPIKHKNIITRDTQMHILNFSLNDTFRLYEYMYNEHSICLKRKRDIFLNYLTTYKSRKRFNDYNRPSERMKV